MLKKIIDLCRGLAVSEERVNDDNYYELVFYTKDTGKWDAALSKVFGKAVKPAGVKPSKEDLAVTREHNNIYPNQTLYRKEIDSITVIAMFWPWSDGKLTTLKMAVIKK